MNRHAVIKNLMWKEGAQKGTTAAFTFITFSVMIFYYYFNVTQMKAWIQFFCIVSILSNISRLWITERISHEAIISSFNKSFLRYCIWVNTASWSVIFALAALEMDHSSYHFAILVTMVSGFVAASLVTLSYDKTIFYPFQFLIIMPTALIATFQWYTGKNTNALYFVFSCVLFIIYQIRQHKTYKSNIIEKFNYQLDLEKSIQELKEAQETLVNQTAALLHASKISALGEMAGGLSHEVNNSLQVVLGATQQAQRELKREIPDILSAESKIQQSVNSVLKIKSVIDGLRYFSQEFESGEKEPVALKCIIDQTLVYTHELLKTHMIEMRIKEVPDVSMQCHAFQVAQILFNLIKNADDALKNDNNSEKWIEIDFDETKDYVHILVTNSGPIISPGNQSKLFQPFFSTKEVNLGTGLSLSISRGIARDHKGDLFYRPQGKNTTFILKLPKSTIR